MTSEPPSQTPATPGGATPPVLDAKPEEPCPWGFWLTVVFGLCVFGAYLIPQWVVLIVASVLQGSIHDPHAVGLLGLNGTVVGIGICSAAPVALGMCWLFVWLRQGPSASDYLGLGRVSWRVYLASFGAILLFNVLVGVAGFLLKRPEVPQSMLEVYQTAAFPPLIWLAMIVGAPVVEEVLFRGFLFKGFERSRVGGVGAVVLTSLAWAAIHLQYEPYEMSVIFAMGLVLGGFRWRTGSLRPALFMHVLNNLAATVQVVWILHAKTSLSALL